MSLFYFWYRFLKFKIKNTRSSFAFFILLLGAITVFQNCTKVQFSTNSPGPNPTIFGGGCSGAKPADEFRDSVCPQQPSTGKIVETRTYSCDISGAWIPGNWTVFSNTCVPTGGACPAGKVYSLGACRDMIVNYTLVKGDDCSHPVASLKIDVIYSGSATPPALPRASGCLEFALNVPGPRHGEVYVCDSSAKDITLGTGSASHWVYTAVNDTWTATEMLRNSLYVPGSYYLNIKPADRSFLVRKGPIVLSNPNGDPNSCGPAGSPTTVPATTTTVAGGVTTTLAPTTTIAGGPTTTVSATTTTVAPVTASCLRAGYLPVNGTNKCAPATAFNGSPSDMHGNPAQTWDVNRGKSPRYSNNMIQWHGRNYVIYYQLNGDKYAAMYDMDEESWLNKFNSYNSSKCHDPWDYLKMWWGADCHQDFYIEGSAEYCAMPVKNDLTCLADAVPITCTPTRSTIPAGTYTNVGYYCTTTHGSKTLSPSLTMCQFDSSFITLVSNYFGDLTQDPDLCPPPYNQNQQ